jgi:hypothetical protein
MKRRMEMTLWIGCAAWLLSMNARGAESASGADDPYAALKLYDGKWLVMASDGPKEGVRLENHCAKTGLFFACEQMVNGKTVALVIFQPTAKLPTGGEEYRSTAVTPESGPSGGWNGLTIEGDRWLYTWDDTVVGKKMFYRNINTFSGPDKIHFEIQNSDDGKTWKKQKDGDETRQK